MGIKILELLLAYGSQKQKVKIINAIPKFTDEGIHNADPCHFMDKNTLPYKNANVPLNPLNATPI